MNIDWNFLPSLMEISEFLQSIPEPLWVIIAAIAGSLGSYRIAKMQSKGESERLSLQLEAQNQERIAAFSDQMRKEIFLKCLAAMNISTSYLTSLPSKTDLDFAFPPVTQEVIYLRMVGSYELIEAVDEWGLKLLEIINDIVPLALERSGLLTDINLAQQRIDYHTQFKDRASLRHTETCQNEPHNTHKIESLFLELKTNIELMNSAYEDKSAANEKLVEHQIVYITATMDKLKLLFPSYTKAIHLFREEMSSDRTLTYEKFEELQNHSLSQSIIELDRLIKSLQAQLKTLKDEAA